MRRFIFEKRVFEKALLDRVDAAVETLNHLTGCEFILVKFMFGRVLALEQGRLRLVAVSTMERPPKATIVGTVDQHRVLFPLCDEGHFGEICNLLDVTTEEDRKELQLLVMPERARR